MYEKDGEGAAEQVERKPSSSVSTDLRITEPESPESLMPRSLLPISFVQNVRPAAGEL